MIIAGKKKNEHLKVMSTIKNYLCIFYIGLGMFAIILMNKILINIERNFRMLAHYETNTIKLYEGT